MLKNKNMDCLFCLIINAKAKAHIVYDSEFCIGFLDVRPVFYGHTLLVTKKHCNNLYDLDKNLESEFMADIKKLGEAVKIGTKSDGTLILVNNTVSQSIPHLHVHIIPRKFNDGLKGFLWPRLLYKTPEQMNEVADSIKSALVK